MKKQNRNTTNILAALLALGIGLAATSGQAQHINAGTLNQSLGGQLEFIGAGAVPLSPGFQQLPNVVTLNYSNSGTFAGLFNKLNGPTFTALAYSNSPFSAARGSFLDLSIVSVAGPAGGSFYFYDVGASAPTYTLGVGGTATTDLFALSEGTADPFGHIHGRYYAVDLPGTYTVGFKIIDTTGYQSASDVYYLNYLANPVPEPAVATLVVGCGALALVTARNQRKAVK